MSLATLYRPKSLASVLGQNLAVMAMGNAISSGSIPQAIMLTGASGVGKTTLARVFALCLSCESAPTLTPCGECGNCLSIQNGSHPDVCEIDSASNTGVDDVRAIICGCSYTPVKARYRIYIIDEIHMLSSQAFNALLKTLECPPNHALFILATTEIAKIPTTVRSRCMHFALSKVSSGEITKQLTHISEKEGFVLSNEAIGLVSTSANGSMRNAIATLELLTHVCNKDSQITTEDVRKVTGTVSSEEIYYMLSSIMHKDFESTISRFRKLTLIHDPIIILECVLKNLHKLCCSAVGVLEAEELSDSELNLIQQVSSLGNVNLFARYWQVAFRGISEAKNSCDVLATSEILLIKLAGLTQMPSPERLAKKFADLIEDKSGCYTKNIEESKKSIYSNGVNSVKSTTPEAAGRVISEEARSILGAFEGSRLVVSSDED